MTELAVRIDAVGDDIEKFEDKLRQWLNDNSEKYLLYVEIGEQTKKLHYQGIVELDLKKKGIDAWRKNLKDMMKEFLEQEDVDKRRNRHSLTQIKCENYRAYISKDKECFICKGYDEEYIKKWESVGYKKNKGKAKTFAEDLYQGFVEKYVKVYQNCYGKQQAEFSIRELYEFLVQQFCDRTKVFDMFILKRFAHLIEKKIHLEYEGNREAYEYFVDKLMDKHNE